MMRDGVRRLLRDDSRISFVGEASTAKQLFSRVASLDVDVLIMDVYLDSNDDNPQYNGFEICRLIKQQYPRIKVLAHSMYDDAEKIAKVIRAGALGFVSKKSGFEQLLNGIKAVASEKFFICEDASRKLKNLHEFLSGLEDTLIAREEIFTSREREVLELIATGYSSKEIAEKLRIAERTVETHRKNMLEKAEVKNTAELIAFAVTKGFVRR
ncbi:response regulator transcription factor [Chryseolinea sp. T2]|uniref:response regulator transcription factor n=1 Tax=Chryseolinea sp. T2 TaxID=3129255 RepID=UPI0030774664